MIDGDLRRDALALARAGKWDDAGPALAEATGSSSGGTASKSSQDDEYRWAGVEDPKVMITTSRDPSARLKKFAKVMRFVQISSDPRMTGETFSYYFSIFECLLSIGE